MEILEQIDAVEGIRRGLDDVANGRTISLEEFEKSLILAKFEESQTENLNNLKDEKKTRNL